LCRGQSDEHVRKRTPYHEGQQESAVRRDAGLPQM